MISSTALTLFFLTSFGFLPGTEPARILSVFPHVGKSHYFMFEPFVFKLAERGHQVTVITHFPAKSPPPNVTFVSLETPDNEVLFNSLTFDIVEKIAPSPMLGSWYGLQTMGVDGCQGLGHPNVQKLLKGNAKFDLLLVEFFNTDCWASLAHVYNVPLAGIFSSVMMPWHNDRLGNPDNPAYIANHFKQYSSKMNFFERVSNTIATLSSKIVYRLFFDIPADAAVAKFLGPNIPPVRDIVRNTSLFMVNSHFTLFQPRPLVPAVVELGGFHVTPSTGKIPADILRFIEGSRDGVVFFSLGSTVRGASMPEDKLKMFQEALSKIPQRVLWKWEDDVMPGKPDNVLLSKWLPQNDILAHPNVKVFISHAGLMGMEEAVYHAVPMLLIPLLGDQPINAAMAAEKGIGLIVSYTSLTVESLYNGLKTVLEDPSYAQNSRRVAKLFLDRPLSIMDTAIYWTEYVIRYNGAPHLRSAVVDLPWYQELLLDVFGFLLCVLLLGFYLVKLVISKVCCRRSKAPPKPKKKKN